MLRFRCLIGYIRRRIDGSKVTDGIGALHSENKTRKSYPLSSGYGEYPLQDKASHFFRMCLPTRTTIHKCTPFDKAENFIYPFLTLVMNFYPLKCDESYGSLSCALRLLIPMNAFKRCINDRLGNLLHWKKRGGEGCVL